MKKLLSVSVTKIYVACSLGLLMTLGAFWHHQVNQTHLDRMTILNQGVGTCFNRISQTFTAMMIKDLQSPYLNRAFMGLSDECLNETIKGINPFKKNVGKGYEALNQLISEVYWFHEKVNKLYTPLVAGKGEPVALGPLADRFSKMETYKLNLIDEIDSASAQLRSVQMNDEILMGAGLIIFILSLSLLSLQEFNRAQLRKEIEKEALNFLTTGKSQIGGMVDQLVTRALASQNMNVTAQLFRDYHGEVLERMAMKAPAAIVEEVAPEKTEVIEEEALGSTHRTSFKEVIVSIQNIQPKDALHTSEIRDVVLDVPYESFEQMLNAGVTQLVSRRPENKKVMISNQIHSDKTIVNMFVAGNTFNANELEFAEKSGGVVDGIDMNLIILKEMVQESGAQMHLENKTDRNGNITGMNIRFVINRVPKEVKTKNLVSVMKGKKKDLTKELMN